MSPLRVVDSAQPTSPSSSQDAQRLTSSPTTITANHPSTVDVDIERQGLPHEAPKLERESTLRTIFKGVSSFFKRSRAQNAVTVPAVHPEIGQLRREIIALQKRCADLEEANHSVYSSCRSSTLNVFQDLRKPEVEVAQSIDSLSEHSECKRTTTNAVVQANVDTKDKVVPARQGLVIQVSTGPESQAEARGPSLAIQPTTLPTVSAGKASSPSLDQNQSGVTPVTRVTAAPVRADTALADSFQTLDIQFSRVGQDREKGDEELSAEVMEKSEAQSGRIDQERRPRKKTQGSEEWGVETLPPPAYQERLPRKRENKRTHGDC